MNERRPSRPAKLGRMTPAHHRLVQSESSSSSKSSESDGPNMSGSRPLEHQHHHHHHHHHAQATRILKLAEARDSAEPVFEEARAAVTVASARGLHASENGGRGAAKTSARGLQASENGDAYPSP